ncbi:MAG: peptidoglycan-associated lipoprotein Pal [Deltaproteobacteria bacterium]|nr:peptidoglycan-associated lipoprotein Pal [Deltaproteobacteria bacterium]
MKSAKFNPSSIYLEEKEFVMKNRVAKYSALFSMLLALTLVGCAKNGVDQSDEVKAPAQQETKADTSDVTTTEQKPAVAAPAEAVAAPVTAFDKKIFFDYDRFDLNPESIEVLNELIAYLKANPDLKVKIEGNCDDRGTTEYNLALGERRAKSAQDFVVTQGIDPERVSTISYGKEKPADPAQNEEAWAKNRRDEFVFSK